MLAISRFAGTRLAKARVALERAEQEPEPSAYVVALFAFEQAARDLADEMVESGYHELAEEGD